jgi:hypothetical protein
MASTATAFDTSKGSGSSVNALLPVDPFRSLLVHFGMLLGVDDFETLDAYHRGKMWLHSAWLHRDGAVWGLRVWTDLEAGEIRVGKGLAVDALGRELYLEQDACLNVPRWFQEHKDDPELKEKVSVNNETGAVAFGAHVVIRFKGCLARQVPAISEPCEGAASTTAYSRVLETAELKLIPGKAPEWRSPPGSLPYHRLRLLFGLEGPIDVQSESAEGEAAAAVSISDSDQEVLDKRAAILAMPVQNQPSAYLDAFRCFAALDEMDMGPATGGQGDIYSLFPRRDPAPMPLADIAGIVLQPTEGGWKLSAEPSTDNGIRPVHVATSTIQELLCGPMCRCDAGEVSDADGPRVDPESVSFEQEGEGDATVTVIKFHMPGERVLKESVRPSGVFVSSFDTDSGWHPEEIDSIDYEYDSEKNRGSVTIQLSTPPRGNRIRLVVKGTGETPLLGHNDVPLAGAVGGPPGGEFEGKDFVFMFKTGG